MDIRIAVCPVVVPFLQTGPLRTNESTHTGWAVRVGRWKACYIFMQSGAGLEAARNWAGWKGDAHVHSDDNKVALHGESERARREACKGFLLCPVLRGGFTYRFYIS